MRREIIWTIVTLVLDIIAGSLIWVCTNLTIPPIAAVITTMICCVASCATFNICEIWIKRIAERHRNKKANLRK